MDVKDIETVSVIGAGLMGHGIAQSFLMGGYPVRLYDIGEAVLEKAREGIRRNLRIFSDHGLLGEEEGSTAMGRLVLTTDLGEAAAGADFVVEAAPEDLSLKQGLFERLESLCREETLLASNTSSLTMAEMGIRVQHRERLVITHWFNPPHIVPVVEVVRSPWTSEETLVTTCRLHEKIRKVPVRIEKEVPGFVINRIQMALVREVLDLYEQGVASAEDIDRAVKGSIGFRLASIGPIRTMDLGGLRLWLRVCENLFPRIQSSAELPVSLKGLVAQGHEGVKTGRGFYAYTDAGARDEIARVVAKRDEEFLQRLKTLYWGL